jgi:hypothetical protein
MSENSSEAMQLRRRLAELATLVTPDTLLHGIESLSLRNMMAASAADLGDHARAQSWKLWWFAWRKRIGVGAIGGFRVPYPFEAQISAEHHCGHSGTARDRNRANGGGDGLVAPELHARAEAVRSRPFAMAKSRGNARIA